MALGNGLANANSVRLGSWEKFKVVNLGSGLVALRSAVSNKYLVSEPNGQCNCNRNRLGSLEKFALKKFGDKIALESHFNKFVVAEANGYLNANRLHLGPWEMFTIIKNT